MTFEEILPQLKAGKKAVRTKGWGDCEEYVFVVSGDTLNGEEINPYLMIRTKENRRFHNLCRLHATSWQMTGRSLNDEKLSGI